MVERRNAVDCLIDECRARYNGAISVGDYRNLVLRLDWPDCDNFEARLVRLGFVITRFATGPDGQPFGTSIPVVKQLGVPISMTPQPDIDDVRCRFNIPVEPDDEVWDFCSSPESWQYLAGRAGRALVRDGVVIAFRITMMN